VKIFITGISGFVGSGLTEYFQQFENIELYGHSRNYASSREKFKGIKIKIVESYSAESLDLLGINCVVHLAGIAHDLGNKFTSDDYYRVNRDGTKQVFNEFVNSKVKKFIFLSSIKACVDSSTLPVTEDCIASPTSHYGKSKRMAEEYLLEQSISDDKSLYIFRPCMIHGKRNKGNLNSLYKYVKSGLPYIFGSYHNERSFLTLDNLNFIISDFVKNSFPSGVYHLSDDEPLSTNELITIISESLDRSPRIWNVPTPLIELPSKIASFIGFPTEKLRQKLTESLVVSSVKLKSVMTKTLPMTTKEGMTHTLQSFHNSK